MPPVGPAGKMPALQPGPCKGREGTMPSKRIDPHSRDVGSGVGRRRSAVFAPAWRRCVSSPCWCSVRAGHRACRPPLPTVLHAPFRSRSSLFAVRLLAWLTLVGLAPDCPAIPRGKRREYGGKQVLVRMRL